MYGWQLSRAIAYDDVSAATNLINAGADVNATQTSFFGERTLLFEAVEKNKEVMVKLLIDAGADVNIVSDGYGARTVLFHALQNKKQVQNKKHRMAQLLIEAGADVNAIDVVGQTPLLYCVEHEDEEMVHVLIAAGADVNITDNEGKTALFYAVQQWNNESVVHLLIDAGADVNISDNKGKTALIYAVQQSNKVSVFPALNHAGAENERKINQERLVRTLIAAGTDVNITDNEGKTALLYAVQQRNNERLVHTLIAADTDVNITDNKGKTALLYAVQQSNNERLVHTLIAADTDVNITDNKGKTALLYAVQQSNKQSVFHLLIDAGADVNTTDNERKTALLYAVQQRNNESVVLALIAAGTDVNITDNEKKTALFYAVQQWNDECDRHALIDEGADVNTTDNERKTALLYAVQQRNNESVAGALIAAGADVNITDSEGKISLLYAVQQRNNESVVRALIAAGADVNITDNEGKSVLFYAHLHKHIFQCLVAADGVDLNITSSKNGMPLLIETVQHFHKDAACILIDAGADVNRTDNEGRTALFYAFGKEIIHKLISHGADINLADKEGKTALFDAIKNHRFDCADSLLEAGAHVNTMDNHGKTALFYAVDYEEILISLRKRDLDSSMVKRLIDVGADVNIQDDNGETALFLAVQSQCMYEFSLASLLIKAGVDVNVKNYRDQTALFLVCENRCKLHLNVKDNESMVQGLIDAGADINATDPFFGNTALITAIICCNYKIVHKLIEAGADVNISNKEGSKTALICALECMVSTFGNDPLDNQEESIFSTAGIVQMLIEKGNANVDARDVYGRTPLFYAISNSIPLSSYLIEKGANVMVRDNFNLSILSVLIENCMIYMEYYLYPSLPLDMDKGLDLLIQHGVKDQAIFDAIVNVVFCKTLSLSKFESSSSLVFRRFEISWLYNILEVARKYTTIFCEKIELKKKEIIDNILTLVRSTSVTVNDFYECLVPKILHQLIELGANPNSVDFYGNTALHYTSHLPSYGLPQDTVINICHLLERFGVSFNVRNLLNETPLLFCFNLYEPPRRYELEGLKTLVEVWRFLLNYGASVEETPKKGSSVFHFVMRLFNQVKPDLNYQEEKQVKEEIIKLLGLICQKKLIKNPLAINKKRHRLNSPLHLWASFEFRMSADEYDEDGIYSFRKNIIRTSFKLLTECGAELNDVNMDGETPLHLCYTWCAVSLLLDAGANPNVIDSEGCSPLLAAAKRRYFDHNGDRGLYMDVFPIDPQGFWKTALKKGLEPWVVDKHGESVLSVLVEGKAFVLAKALVEVARDGNYLLSDTISSSLLNAVCRDESIGTYWKSILVEIILKSGSKHPHSGNANKDSPLHFCCRNIAKSYKKTSSCDDDNVHWTIAKQLLQYGADCRTPDAAGQTCLDLAAGCPPLQDLLLKPINIDEVPIVIPWNSVSEVYKSKLAKVARTRDSKNVKQYWYHKDELQSGSFGVVFAGINEKDGREVAIKRIEKRHMQRPEDKREIMNLTTLADCEQVVNYFYYFEDENFSYVVLELMEGNLDEFLTKKTPMDTREKLCQDVVKGLGYLHGENILHRDLKPTNILFKTHPGLCLKIADFGLSRCIDSSFTTVYGTNAGTRCWIAPDVLKSTKAGDQHSKASDMFSCGLILHYILSVKIHPFTPADCTNKSELQIDHETEANILNGRMEGWDNSLCPEATHLIKTMLDGDDSKRPAADNALDHPFFWTKQKKVDLLIAVGNQPEFECPRAKRTSPLTAVETDLESNFGIIVKYVDWNDPGYVHMPAIYTEMTKKRRYDTKSVVELVRFIRNATAHVSESIRPPPIRKLLLEDFAFLEYFPNLVMEVYKAVTTRGWDHTREEIKYAMLKK